MSGTKVCPLDGLLAKSGVRSWSTDQTRASHSTVEILMSQMTAVMRFRPPTPPPHAKYVEP
ncbi:hypothetical protein T265_02422 [Opisthorchis viverrini]|uniref:Uncharacterized protein n=1 Tax=Opisthorchis viverrini TaxID=6198 RepID=A0A074ZZD7_OPIVI|nr:hypothetical protein T265_02422 [Opisthorchis viverrini]KER31377.1 hypothetical protein T265_02422 [Opisthorchis viverrini]